MKKEIVIPPRIPHAELHLHFGGSISPRILWHKYQEDLKKQKNDFSLPDLPLVREIKERHFKFNDFYSFQKFFLKRKKNLKEYLLMHKIAEPIQVQGDDLKDTIRYFIHRLMRGAYEFENLSYIELRHCPMTRVDKNLPYNAKIEQANKIVSYMQEAIDYYKEKYPIIVKQIICLHSEYYEKPENHKLNDALLEMAIDFHKDEVVCGIDVAGGEYRYDYNQLINQFKRAKSNNLKTTAHLFETKKCSKSFLKMLEGNLVDRIGHGIQIPLKYPDYLKYLNNRDKKVCLEICPATYFQCSTYKDHRSGDFKRIFSICEDNGVDIVIGTDNSGFHHVRLQEELENLLIHEVVEHSHLEVFRKNAFKHAFGLTRDQAKQFTCDDTLFD